MAQHVRATSILVVAFCLVTWQLLRTSLHSYVEIALLALVNSVCNTLVLWHRSKINFLLTVAAGPFHPHTSVEKR